MPASVSGKTSNWTTAIPGKAARRSSKVLTWSCQSPGLGGLESGEVIALFIGLDDDVSDAGSADAEDKLEFEFKVFPTSKDRIYDFTRGDWSIRVHYTLTK